MLSHSHITNTFMFPCICVPFIHVSVQLYFHATMFSSSHVLSKLIYIPKLLCSTFLYLCSIHSYFHSPIFPCIHVSIPEPPEKAMQGPSVAYMKGQQGALISPLAKKRVVLGWTYYTFVLSTPNKKLYQYRSELVCTECLPVGLFVCLLQDKCANLHAQTHTHKHRSRPHSSATTLRVALSSQSTHREMENTSSTSFPRLKKRVRMR